MTTNFNNIRIFKFGYRGLLASSCFIFIPFLFYHVGNVISISTHKEMLWVATFSVVTMMANYFIFRYFSIYYFPNSTMSPKMIFIKCCLTITIYATRSFPFPTRVTRHCFYVRKNIALFRTINQVPAYCYKFFSTFSTDFFKWICLFSGVVFMGTRPGTVSSIMFSCPKFNSTVSTIFNKWFISHVPTIHQPQIKVNKTVWSN